MPRMARLEAERDFSGLIRIYRQSTQLVAVISGAASVTVALFAEPLLWAWTGNRELAHQATPILVLYTIGNAVLAVAAFPYYLQYAKGDLRLHLIGNAAFVVVLIPSIIWAASQYGGRGAGYVWLATNLVTFVAWLPWVHRKFAPGLNLKWYVQDILVIYLAAAAAGFGLWLLLPQCDDRWRQVGLIIAVGVLVMAAAALASSAARRRFARMLGLNTWAPS